MSHPTIETLRVAADAAKEGRRRDAGRLLDEIAPDFEYVCLSAYDRHGLREVIQYGGRPPSNRRLREATGYLHTPAPGRRHSHHYGAP